MTYWPQAPKHSAFTDRAFKFVVGFGLAGGAVWKFWSVTGGDHHDHEALQRTENAKELERCAAIIILFFLAGILAQPTFFPPSFRSLVRRHSSHTNTKTGDLHPEATALKAA